jgi:hypothetical protein
VLDADRLLADARDAAGLSDYGDMTFAEGLNVLVGSVNAEGGLSPANEAVLRAELVRVLVNRLRMQADIAAHPEILDEPLLPPVFITSLPRTGSTKLHRMLAATGEFNALPFWMSYNIAPIPGNSAAGTGEDPRIAAAEEHLQWIYRTAPLYQQMHPQYATEFEEELSLLDNGFNSLYRWAAFLNVPTYIEWVLGRDGVQAFRDLRLMLQYLQWQHYRGLGRRWVLKTPSLFGWEGAYAQTFPGTDFVVTHRHPMKIWPSVCSLFAGVRSLYNEIPLDELRAAGGAVMLHNFSEALKGHLVWRAAYPPEKVLDVRFDEVISDEAALVRRILEWLDLPFTDDAAKNLDDWLRMDAQRGHTAHTKTLADFGLSPAMVEDGLAGYLDRYRNLL